SPRRLSPHCLYMREWRKYWFTAVSSRLSCALSIWMIFLSPCMLPSLGRGKTKLAWRREFPLQPSVEQVLLVGEVVPRRHGARILQEGGIAQLAMALALDAAVGAQQAEVEVDARRELVLDDAQLAREATCRGRIL